ncbi:hypothetical protein H4R33_005594 [Dimargaris cristalligena]|nr:hypothetical protein H4R33_005594 [Dimargaris cristalligena]
MSSYSAEPRVQSRRTSVFPSPSPSLVWPSSPTQPQPHHSPSIDAWPSPAPVQQVVIEPETPSTRRFFQRLSSVAPSTLDSDDLSGAESNAPDDHSLYSNLVNRRIQTTIQHVGRIHDSSVPPPAIGIDLPAPQPYSLHNWPQSPVHVQISQTGIQDQMARSSGVEAIEYAPTDASETSGILAILVTATKVGCAYLNVTEHCVSILEDTPVVSDFEIVDLGKILTHNVAPIGVYE